MFKKSNLIGKKRLFLICGSFNFIITNTTLHISLILMPIFFSTILSQLINLVLGYFLYGKIVFKFQRLTNAIFQKYFLLSLILWSLNFVFIKLFFSLGFNKNLIAIAITPFLVLISFLIQKKWVFT